MSKLSSQDKFFDFSDYGRPFGQVLANRLKDTRFTPIHVTMFFGLSGLLAVYCMLEGHLIVAGFFLLLKSGIDAADGELARIKETPSYSGRYLDSIFDILLNLLFVGTICYISTTPLWIAIFAFVAIQLQGTLYNYYYVILRTNSVGGDSTSKIFENKTPKAFPDENQTLVTVLFSIFSILYRVFDKTIFMLDSKAVHIKSFPQWFMTMISLYGLGFQLLIMAVMLSFQLTHFILPFFCFYSMLLVVFIAVRKIVVH